MRLGVAAVLWLAGCAAGVDPVGTPDAAEEPLLPECASDLSRELYAAMLPVVESGSVDRDLVSSVDASVDPRLYITGPEIFGRWAELIASAEREVTMQFYKWEPDTDPTENLLLGMLALQERRIREGTTAPPVIVRINVDTSLIGAAAPMTAVHFPLIVEQMAPYGFDPAHLDIRLAAHERTLVNQFGNLHVKSIIVDGRAAMITGANPEAQHNYDQPWHDIGTLFYGSVAEAFLSDFDTAWANSQRWTCGPDETGDCLEPTTPVDHVRLPYREVPGARRACHVLALSRLGMPFHNNRIDNPQDQAFLAAFDHAERIIRIETPNLNDDAVTAALRRAVDRGVEVRLITSSGFNQTAEGFIGGPNDDNVAALYAEIAAGGAADPCELLKIRWYSHDGVEPVVGNGPYASHVKYSSIDDEIVIVGTTNMDTASWNFSHELNLAVDDRLITAEFDRQLFDRDWAKAIPVDACR